MRIMIEKMYFINLVGHIKNLDYAIEKYITKFDICLEYAVNQIKDKRVSDISDNNPYNDLAKKASEILKKGIENNNLVISKGDAIKIIEDAQKNNEHRNQILNDLEDELKKVCELIKNLSHFKDLDFDYSSLSKFRFVNFKFGFMPLASYKQYRTFLYNDKDIMVLEGEIVGDYIWCVYFTHNFAAKRVDDIFTSFNFEPVDMQFSLNQTKLFGSVAQILTELENRKEKLKAELDALKRSDRLDGEIKKAAAAKKILQAQSEYETRKFGAVVSKNFFIFTGWVSEKIFLLLEEKTKSDERIALICDDKKNESPPVLLKNNSFFKPFEFLVKMYGTPSYYEIDPTPFLAITYTILFGLMFGDVGQGLILFLVGLLLGKKGPLYKIMSTLGVSSMIFGFLYGSVFGFENLIKPIWMKPADNITFILFFAVIAGVFLILMSMIFNLVNCKKVNDFADLILGPNGVCGFVFYICVLSIVALAFLHQNIFWIYFLSVIAILNLFFIAFAEPIKKFLRKEKNIFGGNIFLFLFETAIELFEVLLSYFTNTVSFVRVGAFALSHAGMMSVVMLLSKSEAGSYNWFIIVLGNIIVIMLEGLIVGIQVLRLEFYEMFGRFFKGNGREYVSAKK